MHSLIFLPPERLATDRNRQLTSVLTKAHRLPKTPFGDSWKRGHTTESAKEEISHSSRSETAQRLSRK
jgi:hypothetical protein